MSDVFNQLLAEYKNQYLLFVSTGAPEHKTAYTNALTAIEEAVSSKQERVDSEKRALQHFASSYEKSNKDLLDITKGTTSLIQDAQDLHDGYETSKKRYTTWTEEIPRVEPVNVSIGYSILLRIGLFMILIPIMVFIGYLSPGGGDMGAAAGGITISSPALRPLVR
jgi:hypothetical protein